MKKTLSILCIAFLVILNSSCKKNWSTNETNQNFFEEAKLSFDKIIGSDTMEKSPQWQAAILETINSKKYLKVPLHFLQPLSAKLNNGDFISADRLVRLVMYKDDQSKWTIEVLTEVPDSDYISSLSKNKLAEFTGSGLVQDWNGKF